jgi:hypothetical protein
LPDLLSTCMRGRYKYNIERVTVTKATSEATSED